MMLLSVAQLTSICFVYCETLLNDIYYILFMIAGLWFWIELIEFMDYYDFLKWGFMLIFQFVNRITRQQTIVCNQINITVYCSRTYGAFLSIKRSFSFIPFNILEK